MGDYGFFLNLTYKLEKWKISLQKERYRQFEKLFSIKLTFQEIDAS